MTTNHAKAGDLVPDAEEALRGGELGVVRACGFGDVFVGAGDVGGGLEGAGGPGQREVVGAFGRGQDTVGDDFTRSQDAREEGAGSAGGIDKSDAAELLRGQA